MQTFLTKDNKTIIYENGIATVVNVKELEAQKALIEKQLSEIVTPTDKQLIDWAKVNYPVTDTSGAVKELERINTVLSTVK